MIAHELRRSPLTIIKANLEAMKDGIWEPTPERIKLAVEEVDRLSKLIAEVQKLSRFERGAEDFIFEISDISSQIQSSAEMYSMLFASKSIDFRYEIERGIAAFVDASKLRQAVENLLSNAIRYTEKGEHVALTLGKLGSDIEISVSDTGIGIPTSDLPFIFERFYKTDRSRARESVGMGIGLSIVKAIAKGHGGRVEAESEPGKGSKLRIVIPIKKLDKPSA